MLPSMDDFVRPSKRPRIPVGQPLTPRARPDQTLAHKAVPPRAPAAAPVQTPTTAAPPPPKPAPNPESRPDKPAAPTPPKPKKRFKLPLRKPRNKKEWIIAIAAGAVLLGVIAGAVYWFAIRDTTPPVVQQQEPEPEPKPAPTTEASRVSGRQLPIGENNKPIYAVQIENSPEARPQSGLREADIIMEAIAEGGITRFNAIYHDNVPANIGPIRSLRPYFIDWFMPYNAPIVHAGGSPEALNDVRTMGVQDMDHGVNGGSFRRVTNRYAPHNLYSTGQQMLDLFNAKGYSNGTFTSLPRKEPVTEDEPAETESGDVEDTTEATTEPELPAASVVNLRISSALYNVTFRYDKNTNRYLRSQGGAAHLDAESGEQLAPDVVIVPIVNKSIHANRIHTIYGTTGSGKVYVFQDGKVIEGTWSKPSRTAQWQLKDNEGNVIALNPGQTWFSIVESADRVTHNP